MYLTEFTNKLKILHTVPTPTTPTCVEQQEPECGYGQVMKTIIGTDGCYKIICRT